MRSKFSVCFLCCFHYILFVSTSFHFYFHLLNFFFLFISYVFTILNYVFPLTWERYSKAPRPCLEAHDTVQEINRLMCLCKSSNSCLTSQGSCVLEDFQGIESNSPNTIFLQKLVCAPACFVLHHGVEAAVIYQQLHYLHNTLKLCNLLILFSGAAFP